LKYTGSPTWPVGWYKQGEGVHNEGRRVEETRAALPRAGLGKGLIRHDPVEWMTMESRQPIRILVVEGHPVVRAGICAILRAEPDFVVAGEFKDARSAIEAAQICSPDIVVMELHFPDKSGMEMIRTLREGNLELRVVVLTTRAGDEEIYQAMQAGASAYIVKDMKHDFLLHAIRRVHAGKIYLPPEVSKMLRNRPPENLSTREREVLLLMAEGKSNRAIAQDLGITEKTVKCHVSMVLARMGVNDRTQAVLAAFRRGYMRP